MNDPPAVRPPRIIADIRIAGTWTIGGRAAAFDGFGIVRPPARFLVSMIGPPLSRPASELGVSSFPPTIDVLLSSLAKHCYHVQVPSGEVVVRQIKNLWRGFSAQLRHHRAQLRLSLRVAVAALLSLAFAQFFHLRLPLWAVLTAVIVTQMSVGGSLKATTDYLAGTLGGALYGGALAILVPHSSEIALLAVLALAVAPLALIAAINPSLAAAPVTAIIVLLTRK